MPSPDLLVVGLGNPGPRYAATRHNLGYRVVERLAARATDVSFRSKFHGEFAVIVLSGVTLGLLTPTTFMNESGRSVQAALAVHKLPLSSIYVAHDDLDLPFASLRLKVGGGDGGHRGLRSISAAIGPLYVRLRVGIGRPPPEFQGAPADFVLQGLSLAEREELDSVLDRAADALVLAASRGIEVAMNATNQRKTR